MRIDDHLEIEQRFHAAGRTIEDLRHDRGTIDVPGCAMILSECRIRIESIVIRPGASIEHMGTNKDIHD